MTVKYTFFYLPERNVHNTKYGVIQIHRTSKFHEGMAASSGKLGGETTWDLHKSQWANVHYFKIRRFFFYF